MGRRTGANRRDVFWYSYPTAGQSAVRHDGKHDGLWCRAEAGCKPETWNAKGADAVEVEHAEKGRGPGAAERRFGLDYGWWLLL